MQPTHATKAITNMSSSCDVFKNREDEQVELKAFCII